MRNVVMKLKNADVKNIKGFITEEIRNQRLIRIGFDVVDLSNNEIRGSLARIS
jgi:nucleoside-triphosphatase THEP1